MTGAWPVAGVILAGLVMGACTASPPAPSAAKSAGAAVGAPATPARVLVPPCQPAKGSSPPAGPHAFDAADVRAATLPQEDLGPGYATFVFDTVLGGFETNEERARKSTRAEAPALAHGGRLLGYHAMYHPPPPDFDGPVERIYTLVGLFPDAAGASAHFAALPPGATTGVGGIGEEAKLYRTSESTTTQTRVQLRRGHLVGTVGINRTDVVDVDAEAIALARALDGRLLRSLRGELRGYTGAAGGEIPAQRMVSMAIPITELGGPFNGWKRHPASGLEDNQDRLMSASLIGRDRDEELSELDECGRIAGWLELAFEPQPPPPPNTVGKPSYSLVMSSAHLFADAQGAAGYVARFVQRDRQMAGKTLDGMEPRIVGDVVEFGLAPLGDSVSASDMKIEGLHRVVVLVRRGRVVGETMVIRPDSAQARREALDLAARLDARIAGVLAAR